MATLKEMAQAHLLNVQQQINDLEAQKQRIDQDIQALRDYLLQGAETLDAEYNGSEEVAE